MDQQILILIPVCVALGIVTVFIIAKVVDSYRALMRDYQQTVEETSQRCKQLRIMNAQYPFSVYNPVMHFSHQLNSKSQYDRFDLVDLFLDALENNRDEIERTVACHETNIRLYRDYLSRLDQLPAYATAEYAEEQGIPYKKYHRIEAKLYQSFLLHPQHRFQIICEKTYTSPQGRRSYHDAITLSSTDVRNGFEMLKSRLYKQQIVRNQRSLMTPKLRYSIMQRDHFRCVLCGRDKDSSPLEVDHIVPVSRGGMTVPENLRTLCRDCNRGKSNSYSSDGYN